MSGARIVFAGPSIAGLPQSALDGLEQRAPVRQGDIYRATLENPSAIGIIDGYFEGVPAVWHKEILWALTRGIPVLGAASMGALRAAEMHPFGMVGVGRIFEDYRDGVIDDDDEVALLHGPPELGAPLLSLAMVNVRATVQAATEAGVLETGAAEALLSAAKGQFYKKRTWDTVLAAAPHPGFTDWVRTNEVDQKQADAAALLDHLRIGDFVPPDPGVTFEETNLWLSSTRRWRQREAPRPQPGDGERLFGDDFR